jgi:molecular chaperone GrpE
MVLKLEGLAMHKDEHPKGDIFPPKGAINPGEELGEKSFFNEVCECEESSDHSCRDDDACPCGDGMQISFLKEELQRAHEQIRELEDKWLRACADHDNYRKRVVRDHDERVQLANESLIAALLPILDNFSLGLKAVQQHKDQGIVQGFFFIFDQLRQLLHSYGLEPIGVEGDIFDCHSQEAISMVTHEHVAEGRIVEVVRLGYRLGKKLLRPAAVTVSSGPAQNSSREDVSGDSNQGAEITA